MILSAESPDDEDLEDERYLIHIPTNFSILSFFFILDFWKFIKRQLMFMELYIQDLLHHPKVITYT